MKYNPHDYHTVTLKEDGMQFSGSPCDSENVIETKCYTGGLDTDNMESLDIRVRLDKLATLLERAWNFRESKFDSLSFSCMEDFVDVIGKDKSGRTHDCVLRDVTLHNSVAYYYPHSKDHNFYPEYYVRITHPSIGTYVSYGPFKYPDCILPDFCK